MTNVGERISFLIKELGLNKNSFSKEIGLKNNSTITNIINNPNRSPSYDVILKILTRYEQLNVRWLIAGQGRMFSISEDAYPNINDRLSHISRKYAMTLSDVAGRLGVDESELRSFFYEYDVPPESLIKKYIEAFPDVNPDWIRYNHLPMMLKGKASDYIPPDAIKRMIRTIGGPLDKPFDVLVNCNNAQPAHIVRLESFLDCDIAMEVFGEEMAPEFIPGDVILCVSIRPNAYMYELPYIVITDTLNHLRYIKDSGKADKLLLESPNAAVPAMEIHQADIAKLFLVKGKIRRFQS